MPIIKNIGTDLDLDIVLNGKYISKKHAVLLVEEGRIYIEDLGSTFGTHVNGKLIDKRTELKPKDRVRLGTQIFHWTDYIGEKETDDNPVYIKDLFSPYGLVNWQDYKVILLIVLGMVIVIPIGIPAFLAFTEHRLNRRGNNGIELMQYVKPLLWMVSIFFVYVFLNLSQKAIRNRIRK